MATTVTYSFNLPTVSGDENTWGGLLNDNWTDLDAILDGTTALVPGLSFNDGVDATDATVKVVDPFIGTINLELAFGATKVNIEKNEEIILTANGGTGIINLFGKLNIDRQVLKAGLEQSAIGTYTLNSGLEIFNVAGAVTIVDGLEAGELCKLVARSSGGTQPTWPANIRWRTGAGGASAPTLDSDSIIISIIKVGGLLYAEIAQ